MGKLFDPRIIDKVELVSMNVNFQAVGHGHPNVWAIYLIFTFICFDEDYNALGSVQSGNDSRVPIYTLVDNLTAPPTWQEVSDYLFKAADSINVFIAQQLYNLNGVVPDKYTVSGEKISKNET